MLKIFIVTFYVPSNQFLALNIDGEGNIFTFILSLEFTYSLLSTSFQILH